MRKLVLILAIIAALVAVAAPAFASQYTCGAPPIPMPLPNC